MGHCVGLQVSRALHIPMLCANWDLGAQQCAGTRPASASGPRTHLHGCQQPVHCRCAHPQQVRSQINFEPFSPLLLIMRQPNRQCCHKPFAARLLGCQPNRFENLTLRLSVNRQGPSPPLAHAGHPSHSPQHLDRILALVAAQSAHLVQDPASAFPIPPPVRLPRLHHHLQSTLLTIFKHTGPWCPFR